MRFLPARALAALFSLSAVFSLLTTTLRADLVWTKETGWRVEGGALSGLAGAEGRNALDQMNKAREAEENGSTHSAFKSYEAIGKKYPNSIYAPEALYRAARLHLARREYNKAFDDFQQVLSRY